MSEEPPAVVAGLLAEVRAMSPAARLAELVELQARIARLHARELVLLAAVDADPVTVSLPAAADSVGGDRRWAVEDVAVALRVSLGAARARLEDAREAVRLPRLVGLLAAGTVSPGHVRAVTEVSRRLDDATLAAVQERVLSGTASQVAPGEVSLPAWRARVRRAVLLEAAETVAQRRAANVADRRVCVQRAGEGTSTLWALLPDEGAAALISAIDALAQRRGATQGTDLGTPDSGGGAGGSEHDERTTDQRRADALVQLALDALAGEHSTVLPSRAGLRPAMQVTVALSTLLGLDEQPGELAGIGPIPAALAREIAHDPTGTWRRLVIDSRGQLLDYGRTTYRPPAALHRHVIARDRTCRFPHCTRSAARSDLDHTIPWSQGGTTAPDNLTALCPRHHRLRHETAWTYHRTADGTTAWTTPTRTRHTVPAAIYPLDTTSTQSPTIDTTGSRALPVDTSSDPDPPPF